MPAATRKSVFGRGSIPSSGPVSSVEGRRFPLILLQGWGKAVPSHYTNTGERVKNIMACG